MKYTRNTEGMIPQDVLFYLQGDYGLTRDALRCQKREVVVTNLLIRQSIEDLTQRRKRVSYSGLVKFFLETKMMPNVFFKPIIRAYAWYQKENLLDTIPFHLVNIKDERFFIDDNDDNDNDDDTGTTPDSDCEPSS